MPAKKARVTKAAPKKAAPKKAAPKKAAPKKAAPKKAAPKKEAPNAPPKTAQRESMNDQATEEAPADDDEPAPQFALPDQDGRVVTSSDLGGQLCVLYFYPRDDTPGCTVEACDFRDQLLAFERGGVRVVGVSPDSTESHRRFSDKHGLPFTLLSDPTHQLARAYGVWVTKKGSQRMGIERSTFLVSADGRVVKRWRGVRVAGHVSEVLRAARALG